MKLRMLFLLAACLFPGCQFSARAQETTSGRMPDEVFYLMPSFGDGMVYIKGQRPAQGKMNICAVDNTLRYLDKDGTELSAGQNDDIIMVTIDGVTFLRDNGFFYRRYPVTADFGVALKRSVTVMTDVKEGAYGTKSHTSSITQISNLYADGINYELNKAKEYPYTVSETVFLYRGNEIILLNKRNLRKLFPEKKAEMDAWFKAGNKLPDTLDGTLALLARWTAAE